MYTLEEIFEQATSLAREAEAARGWFWNSLAVEDHELYQRALHLIGDDLRVREWLFTEQDGVGESPALWLVRGERTRVLSLMEAIAKHPLARPA